MAPMQPGMIWIGWISLATVLLMVWTAIQVARTRGRSKILPPAMAGDPALERALRVQANTLEQGVPFLVALWLCAVFWAPFPAAIGGIVWLFGRVIYALGYYRAPERRLPGFGIGMLALAGLIIGAAFGLIRMGIVLGAY